MVPSWYGVGTQLMSGYQVGRLGRQMLPSWWEIRASTRHKSQIKLISGLQLVAKVPAATAVFIPFVQRPTYHSFELAFGTVVRSRFLWLGSLLMLRRESSTQAHFVDVYYCNNCLTCTFIIPHTVVWTQEPGSRSLDPRCWTKLLWSCHGNGTKLVWSWYTVNVRCVPSWTPG
jgi:hypothetical protein